MTTRTFTVYGFGADGARIFLKTYNGLNREPLGSHYKLRIGPDVIFYCEDSDLSLAIQNALEYVKDQFGCTDQTVEVTMTVPLGSFA